MHNSRFDNSIRSRLKDYRTPVNTEHLRKKIEAKRNSTAAQNTGEKRRLTPFLLVLLPIVFYFNSDHFVPTSHQGEEHFLKQKDINCTENEEIAKIQRLPPAHIKAKEKTENKVLDGQLPAQSKAPLLLSIVNTGDLQPSFKEQMMSSEHSSATSSQYAWRETHKAIHKINDMSHLDDFGRDLAGSFAVLPPLVKKEHTILKYR